MARQRRIKVHGVRRETPDLRRLGQAAIAMVQAQMEADAAAEHAHRTHHPAAKTPDSPTRGSFKDSAVPPEDREAS